MTQLPSGPDGPLPPLAADLDEDFQLLQQAALAEAAGTVDPRTASVLREPALAHAKVAALIHAETLARGRLHCAQLLRLGYRGAAEQKQAAQWLELVSAARKRARRAANNAATGSSTVAGSASRGPRAKRPSGLTLATRMLRAADRERFDAAVDSVLTDRGIDAHRYRMPHQDVWQWWTTHSRTETDDGFPGTDEVPLPEPVAVLLALPAEDFVEVLLRDARQEENPYLAHDAVVERWASSSATAQAWGRYAVAQAERAALARPILARAATLGELRAAYADLAVLNMRAYQAWHSRHKFLAPLHTAHSSYSNALVPDLPAVLQEAFDRLVVADPELGEAVSALAAQHERTCPSAASGCRTCHTGLGARLRRETASADGDTRGEQRYADYATRYALLTDLPSDVPWAVADAALGTDSAVCGWAWAGADGTNAWGWSFAANSGEAELVALCEAVLQLLTRHPHRQVVALCDNAQAVDALAAVLALGEPEAAAGCAVLPESRALLGQIVPQRERVSVRWLKGHVGHALNETADGLAVLAFRYATGRLPARQVGPLVNEIKRNAVLADGSVRKSVARMARIWSSCPRATSASVETLT